MNILTKICVVLLVVASLVAAVVFTTMATVQPNWRAAYQQEKLAKESVDAKCRELMDTADRAKAALDKARLAQDSSAAALRSENTKLKNDLAELKLKNAELSSGMSEINSKLAGLEAAANASQKANTTLQKQLKESWDREVKKSKEVVSMTELFRTEQAKAQRYEKSLRVAMVQVNDQKRRIESLNSKLSKMEARHGVSSEAKSDQPVVPSVKVSGTVTGVSEGNLAKVNIGSANGLKAGMQLIVYRGERFVGHLRIKQVRQNEAAGEITDKCLNPMQGDKVTSHLN